MLPVMKMAVSGKALDKEQGLKTICSFSLAKSFSGSISGLHLVPLTFTSQRIRTAVVWTT